MLINPELAPLGCVPISEESTGKAPSVSTATHRWAPDKPPCVTTSPRANTEVPLDGDRPSSRSDMFFREHQGSPLRHVVGSVHPLSPVPVGVTQDQPMSYTRPPVPYYDPVAEAQRVSPSPSGRFPSDPVTRESWYHNEQRAPPPVSLPSIQSFYFPPRHGYPPIRQHPHTFTVESRQGLGSGIAAPPQTPEPPRPGPTDVQETQTGETKNISSAPNGSQSHGALFEALLLATSLSSSEPSPSGSSNGRSGSVSSVTTTVENSNDDNSNPVVEPVDKNDQSL